MAQRKQNVSKKSAVSIDSSQIAAVNPRRTISDHKRQDSIDRLGKTTPVSMIQMFKSGHGMEIGVKMTDMIERSTLHGETRKQADRKSLKLSEFRQNSSSFKARVKTEDSLKKKVSRLSGNKMKGFAEPRKLLKLNRDSEVQSKMISSSISQAGSKNGRITKDERLFTQNFEELF